MAALVALGAITLAAPPALAQQRVFYQSFDDPNQLEDFWLKKNNCAKKIVDASDGAVVHRGSCLRGNWQAGITDPITGLTTADGVASRYSNCGPLYVDSLGIVDEMYLDYWAFVDSNATKDYGAKWIWLEGSYKIPDEYGNAFNHIVQPPWKGWNTWRIISNNTVGDRAPRTATLSSLPGITALRGSQSVDEWFQGRWHHFQVYVKLNTPASAANGILKFWLDEVLVLDVADYKYRDVDADQIKHFTTPHMYGGGTPPPGPFGWQLDELEIWDGIPSATPDAGSDLDPAQDAGAAAQDGASADTSAPAAGDAQAARDFASAQDAAEARQPAGDDSGCSCVQAPGASPTAWLVGALLLIGWWRRPRRRDTP